MSLKKIMSNDNTLKVLSVIIAIVIWLYIILVLDPAVEVSVRDLPIQFVGQEILNANGLSVVSESATTVNIKIRGSRRKMGNNDMKTIIVKADVSGIASEGNNTIPLEVVVPFENAGITSQEPFSVDVKAEKLVEKNLPISIKTEGTLAENYMAGEIKLEPESVVLRGAESAVGKVTSAEVVLDYAGADVDIDVEVPIRFYGTDGKELSSLDALFKRISKNASEAKIHCAVVKIREIKPQLNFGDALAPEGTTFSTNPEVLYIYGDDTVTAKVTSIPTETIPLERLLDNKKVKVKLVIPEGVKILRDVTEIEVSVNS